MLLSRAYRQNWVLTEHVRLAGLRNLTKRSLRSTVRVLTPIVLEEASAYIIAYPEDPRFLDSALVQLARQQPKFRQLHDVVQAVGADARVQLAMRHDLVPTGSQAAWNGAPALAASATIGLAVVKALMNWSYRTLAEQVDASAGWRWVCQLYFHAMPDFRTIRDRIALLQPSTLRLINRVLIELGQSLGVTTGSRLRVDSSVTETDIHYPTDSSLLDDAARVLSRTIRQVRRLCPPAGPAETVWYQDRHRAAHHRARQIAQAARSKKAKSGKVKVKLYVELIEIVETLIAHVEALRPRLKASPDPAAQGLRESFDQYVPLVQQVITQTRHRILEAVSVTAADKIVSLFEPHTAIIRRGKAQPHETEFGCKVWFSEVEGGLVSEWRILSGNPSDASQLIPSLQQHRRLFGRVPREVSGDRGVHSPANEREARALGVKRVCLPQPGHKTARRRRHEHQPWFRAACRFRAGIEGRISQLRRARSLTRCRDHGPAGMERCVGWGVIANNSSVISQFLIKHRRSLVPCDK